jgi:hypothetical protein
MNFFNWLISEWLGNVFNSFRLFADWMAKPFSDPWKTLKKLFSGKAPSRLRSAFLFLLLVAVIVGLGALTWYLGLDRMMNRGPRWFRMTWMGWVALLVFVIIRLGIAILRQLKVLSPSFSRFGDIDAAIQRGVEAAEAAGIPIDQVPIFLVVGLSRAAEQEFSASVAVGRDVHVSDDRLPLHWYGGEKGLWITVPGVSATCLQADLLAEARPQGQSAEVLEEELVGAATGSGISGMDAGRTISMGAFLATDPQSAAAVATRARETVVEVPVVPAKKQQRARDRMRYLCQALQGVRHPVCTINGVLLCVPFNDRVVAEKVSQQFRDCVKTDMTALQSDIGVRCMSAVVFTGCNDNSGFKSYIQSLPPQSIVHRCGVSFPQLVELGEADPEKLHGWLQRDFELQSMQLYKSRAGLPINEDIFRFVDLVRRSRTYFTSILRSAFLQPSSSAMCFAGVYFAELSPVSGVAHPFLQGVLAKALREHDEVISWTQETLDQDTRQKRTSRVLLLLTVLFLLANVYLFWKIVTGQPIYSGSFLGE